MEDKQQSDMGFSEISINVEKVSVPDAIKNHPALKNVLSQ